MTEQPTVSPEQIADALELARLAVAADDAFNAADASGGFGNTWAEYYKANAASYAAIIAYRARWGRD